MKFTVHILKIYCYYIVNTLSIHDTFTRVVFRDLSKENNFFVPRRNRRLTSNKRMLIYSR